ncbi:MAG: ABC transporter ATP-binding protein [Fluviicola sp.]|nr:ABC transporter ATP-binding protein [Fluviicola sp.]
MLAVRSLNLAFKHAVLHDLTLEVQAGSIVGIVGPSGGGKSSLLKIIAGLLDANSGEVTWKDKRVKGPADQLVPGHPEIQLVNQDFGLDIYHTVEENVVQKMLYLPTDVRQRFSEELLDLVELTHLRGQQAIHLSGGEQQRLAIARSLAMEPEVILLDEPFAHLDAHLKVRIGNYLKVLSEVRGTTCILVSHEGQDVLQWCSTIHFMQHGVIQRSDSPEAFYFNPSSAYEALFFGEINVLNEGQKGELLFRPNEYTIVQSGQGITVRFITAQFAGAYWRNTVCTSNNETLVLFAQQSMDDVEKIEVTKRYS